jgi:hypothetical protein
LNQPGPLGAQRFGFKKWAVGIKGYWPPELEITNKCLGKLCNSWHATPKWMHPQRVVVQQKKCVPLVTCWEANQRGLAAHWPDNATYYQWQCSILHDTLCAEITQVNRVAIYFDMSSKAYVIFHGSIFFSAQKLFGGGFQIQPQFLLLCKVVQFLSRVAWPSFRSHLKDLKGHQQTLAPNGPLRLTLSLSLLFRGIGDMPEALWATIGSNSSSQSLNMHINLPFTSLKRFRTEMKLWNGWANTYQPCQLLWDAIRDESGRLLFHMQDVMTHIICLYLLPTYRPECTPQATASPSYRVGRSQIHISTLRWKRRRACLRIRCHFQRVPKDNATEAEGMVEERVSRVSNLLRVGLNDWLNNKELTCEWLLDMDEWLRCACASSG